MGVDLLSSSGEEFYFNNAGWRYLLTYAEAHGFRWPAAPDGDERDGLSAEEAADLAGVLEQCLAGRSLTDAAAHVSMELTNLLLIPSESELFRDDPVKVTAQTIEHWLRFAQFARTGGFSVMFLSRTANRPSR